MRGSKLNKYMGFFRITHLEEDLAERNDTKYICTCTKTFTYIDTHSYTLSPHKPSTGCVVFHSSFQLSEHLLSALYSGRCCQKESVSPLHKPRPSSSIQRAPALAGDGGRIPAETERHGYMTRWVENIDRALKTSGEESFRFVDGNFLRVYYKFRNKDWVLWSKAPKLRTKLE